MNSQQLAEITEFSFLLKHGLWFLGVIAWIFGILDRSIASFSDGSLSATEVPQLLTIIILFGAWLFLKPKSK
jgi:hypothetical protein